MGLTPAILDDALILRGKPAIQVGHDPRPTGVNDQMPKTWQSLRINKLTRADPARSPGTCRACRRQD